MTTVVSYVQGIVIGYIGTDDFFHGNRFTHVGELVEVPATQCEVSPVNPNHVLVTTGDEYGTSSIILSDISIRVKEYTLPTAGIYYKEIKTELPS